MRILPVFACLTVLSCGGGAAGTHPDREHPSVQAGADVFTDAGLASTDARNPYSCADCHGSEGGSTERIFPGGSLGGAVERPHFWGGQETDLLRAVNACRMFFMRAETLWTADDESALALYAYLSSLAADVTDPVPFTVAREITPPPCALGDAVAGETVFLKACATCHGVAHSGAGAKAAGIPVLPEDALRSHGLQATCDQGDAARIFLSKVRHGPFFDEGGTMPPFSSETLSDENVADLFTFLGLVPSR